MDSSPRIDDLASLVSAGEAEPITGVYGEWARALFPEPVPREQRATCSACPMVTPDPAVTSRALPVFSPVVKCCTYLPSLPNYLVGSILDDAAVDPRGRESVVSRIARRTAVTPLGLGQTGTFRLTYEASQEEVFGRADSLRCPHYLDGGACGIWKHRNSICSTWFCKHVRGDVSRQFWTAFKELLGCLEAELSVWAAAQAGISDAVISSLLESRPAPFRAVLIEELTGIRAGVVEAELWGPWRGREAEYFIETSRLVAQQSWGDVLKLCGSRARVLTRHALKCYAALIMPRLPSAIEVEPVEGKLLDNGLLSFSTFSRYDPIVLTAEQWAALRSLAGTSLPQAMAALAADPEGTPVSAAMLQAALDWRLLRAGVDPQGP